MLVILEIFMNSDVLDSSQKFQCVSFASLIDALLGWRNFYC